MVDIEKKVLALNKKGVSAEDIAIQLDLTVDEVEDIIEDSDTDEEQKSNKKTIEEKMETTAENTAVGKVIERTKSQSLAIQKAKEAIGDYIYGMFENSGIPVEQMIDFADTAVNFFIENYDATEDLKLQLETAEGLIEQLYNIADTKAQTERIIKEYVLKCATEGTQVDSEFVKNLLVA